MKMKLRRKNTRKDNKNALQKTSVKHKATRRKHPDVFTQKEKYG